MAILDTKVNSSNITYLSLSAAFNVASSRHIPTPTKDELINNITKKFDTQIKNTPLDNAKRDELFNAKRNFINIVNGEIPEGFEIVPVLANPKNTKGGYEDSRDEYEHGIQNQFIKFIGRAYEDKFKEMGVSKYVTKLLKKGMLLCDTFYASVDHVIERSLGGKLTTRKLPDNNNWEAKKPVFEINHFNNLTLIPQQIHERKNSLRDAQFLIYPIDKPTYILMLVPKPNSETPFMTIPQSHKKDFGVEIKSDEQVALSLIEYLNTQPKRFVLSKDKRIEALKCITEELNDKAADTRDKDRINKVYDFYANQSLHELAEKVKLIETKEVKNFNIAINKVKKALENNGLQYFPYKDFSTGRNYKKYKKQFRFDKRSH